MKKRYRIIYPAITLVLCLALLFGCSGQEQTEQEKIDGTYLCFVNLAGDGLVREAYEIKGDSMEEEVEDVLASMKKEPDSIDYKSAFPENVRVSDWSLSGDKLDLVFNDNYLKMTKAEEVLLRAAVVESLGQISGVDAVSFFIGTDPLKDSDGNEIGYMTPDDFVQNTGSSLHTYQTGELTLYFANEKGDALTAENVSVRYNSSLSVEKLIVEQLIKGPSFGEGRAVIPPETQVLGVSVRDGICYVNLDDGFLDSSTGVDPKVTVYAIVNSVTEGGNAGQVQILVNGESNIQYMNRVDLSKPMTRNLDLVEENHS